jgi:hypothetical protein
MKLKMDTMRLSKIVETALATNDIAVFEYRGRGINEEIVVTTSAPGVSHCIINIKKGFLEKVQMEGTEGQKFAVDLNLFRNLLKDERVGISKAKIVDLKYEDQKVTLDNFEIPMVQVPNIDDTVPPTEGETVEFMMNPADLKHIVKIAAQIDTLLRVSVSNGRGGLKGKDVYFSAEEVKEIFTTKGDVGEVVDGKDLFTAWFFVEPLLQITNELRTTRDEKIRFVIGKNSPLELLLRITEDIYVSYKQTQKIIGEGMNSEFDEKAEESAV